MASNDTVAISGGVTKDNAHLVENTIVLPAFQSDLVELAKQIQSADVSVQSNVTNKLNIIFEQIQFLQEQARTILEKAKLDSELHQAACNILKRPGQIYYYYLRQSGQKYLTIMSPSDWGAKCPHEFLGGYRLEYDNSWVPVKDIEQVDERKALINKVMNRTMAIKDALNQ